jgi:hypothetical protein
MNYYSIKKPQNHHNHLKESLNPSEDISYRSTSAELVSVISSEWLEESELSSDVIRWIHPLFQYGAHLILITWMLSII